MIQGRRHIVALLTSVGLTLGGCAEGWRSTPSDETDAGINHVSPVTSIELDFEDCGLTCVSIYNVRGEFLGVPLDSVVCGPVEINLLKPRIVNDGDGGTPDTVFRADLASGVYFYSVKRPDHAVTRKFMFVR